SRNCRRTRRSSSTRAASPFAPTELVLQGQGAQGAGRRAAGEDTGAGTSITRHHDRQKCSPTAEQCGRAATRAMRPQIMQAFSTQRRHLATTRLRKIAAASLLVLTLITGCSHSMNEVDAGSVKAHLNPHPKERYELTFTVHDAPGPFDSVTADVLYVVNNPMCIPHDPFTGGQSKSPGVTRPIPLERIAPQTYRGEVT